MKRIIIFILLILLFGSVTSFADTHTAASCSLVDVTTAFTAAAGGDTVIIPPGSCTWTSGITINKAITIQGAGTTQTIITHNASAPLITISPASATDSIRITGIYFNNQNYLGTTRCDIYISGNSTAFRIDNCHFYLGKEVISLGISARHNGVIDSCIFEDVDLGIRAQDYADYYNSNPTNSSWGRTIAPGTSDALFIENNTFTTTNRASCNMLNESIYNSNAARSVVRYNTFNNACSVTIDTIMDAHGLGGCDRGTVIAEIYNNSFTVGAINVWGKFRGGSIVMHDNTITLSGSNTTTIRLSNEQAWAGFSDYGGEWPSMDQLFNSYFYNNTIYNSGACSGGCEAAISYYNASLEADFIVENRDYFLHAPQATGGKTTFGGFPGVSNDYCTGSGTATLWQGGTTSYPCCTGNGTGTCDMTFSASGANAYYPYTIYTCPHPLADPSAQGSCTAETAGTTGYTLTGGGDDVTAPTVISASVNTTGSAVLFTFSENITSTSGAAFTLDFGTAVTLTCPAVSTAANSMTCPTSRTIYQSEGNGTYGYTGTKVVDTASTPNALATIDSSPVAVNLSTEIETPPAVALTITSHTGAVATSSPTGLNCGSTCAADFETGTVVTVSGYCLSNYQNIVIGGDCNASTGEVTMSEARTCTVTCTKISPDYTLGSGAAVTIGSGAAATIY